MNTTEFNISSNIDLKEPFICTLSPLMHLGVHIKNMNDMLLKLAARAVEGILEKEDVANSLKRDSKAVRQIDMKNQNGQIITKGFVMWNAKSSCWHVLFEGSLETYWEEKFKNAGEK